MKKTLYKKIKLCLLALSVIGTAGVSTAYAIMNSSTKTAVNTFTGTTVNVGIVEGMNGTNIDGVHEDHETNVSNFPTLKNENDTTSKEVEIQNMGGNSYVRVRFNPVIKSQDGNTALGKSVNVEYTFADSTYWKKDSNDVYYYTKVLEREQTTEMLLKSVTLKEAIPDGYILELHVLTDAIMVKPDTVLHEAWGITNFSQLKNIK